MRRHLNRVATAAVGLAVLISGSSARAADCEEIVGRHMVGEALLAAHFVAIAEKAGMSAAEINAILKQVAEKSAIEEFWISDPSGRAYLNNSGIDFTFDPDPAKQPQASQFWPLIKGEKGIVIQETRKREIDDRVFKYVGVAGVDKSRIVQVGASAANLPACK
ncbi:MAG: hypothetical protein HY246_22970 [Proteobacteria bacterium]|nr:hypothetical protein [Pseudomonadota bacterium]